MTAVRRTRRSPYGRLRDRAVFAVALLAFLVLGIVVVGDLSAQWWVLLLPVALLVGPVLAVRREAGGQPDDDHQNKPWG